MKERLREGLFRHSVLLMLATQVGNVANTVFQMVMGRSLSSDEYGILVTMTNIMLVLASPLQALRSELAHYASELVRADRAGDVPRLVRRWAGLTGLVAAPVAASLMLAHRPVASFFGLDDSTPVLVLGLLLAATPFLSVAYGALLGMQAFRWMAGITCSMGLLRLGAGAAFVLLVAPKAEWALSAQIVAALGTTLLAAVGVAFHARHHTDSREPSRESGLHFMQSCLLFAGFGILMYADMIMVRHYLTDQAGWFGYAATIGRSVIFLPMPIALAMFPKVTSQGKAATADWRILRRAIVLAFLIIGAAVGGCLVLPRLALLVMFGIRNADASLVRLVQGMVLATSPLSLSFLLMNFEMAQRRFEIVPMALVCAAGYVGWVVFHHDSPWHVVGALGVASTVFLLLLLVTMRRSVKRQEGVRDPDLCDPHHERP